MFEVSVRFEFSSAHRLRNYKGKCENLHGHNWKVEAEVSSRKLDSIGMVIDFKELKMKTNKILDELDHTCLNDFPYFKKINPTSENIAKYIYDRLKQVLETSSQKPERPAIAGAPNQTLHLKIKVWETDTSCASYYVTTNDE